MVKKIKTMESALHIKTEVLPGNKIEIQSDHEEIDKQIKEEKKSWDI